METFVSIFERTSGDDVTTGLFARANRRARASSMRVEGQLGKGSVRPQRLVRAQVCRVVDQNNFLLPEASFVFRVSETGT